MGRRTTRLSVWNPLVILKLRSNQAHITECPRQDVGKVVLKILRFSNFYNQS